MSSKTQLPIEVETRISKEAIENDVANRNENYDFRAGFRRGYGVGATAYAIKLHEAQQENEKLKAEAERAQERENLFEDVMRQVLNIASWADDPYKSTLRRVVEKAQLQWKEGKEEPVKEIEYMPLHSGDHKHTDLRQIPMHILSEEQADANHGQTLRRLKERGGIGVHEAISLINKQRWTHYSNVPMKEAVEMLKQLITNPPK